MMIPDILLERVVNRQCVAFIGAGFSMPCNMPGWWGLLEWLIEEARRSQLDDSRVSLLDSAEALMEEGRLDDAADILSMLMPPADLHAAISKRFHRDQCQKSIAGVSRVRMDERINNLLTIPWAAIVTTNYDTLIDDGISRQETISFTPFCPSYQDFGMVFSSFFETQPFVKLHGSVEGGGYVLSTRSYETTYLSKPQVVTFLEHIMLSYYLVFIGCSLEDAILDIRRVLCDKFGIYPPAYALLPSTEENRKRRRELEKKANIWPFFYEPQKDSSEPSHMEVDRILQALVSIT